jgi:hypothetical protein
MNVSHGQFGRGDHLLVCGIQPAVTNVFHHRAGEQEHILQHDPQLFAQIVLFHLADVDPVDVNAAAVNVVKTCQQIDDRRLSRPRRPDQGDRLARFGVQVNVFEHRDVLFVAKVHLVKTDVSSDSIQRLCIRSIGQFGYLVNDLEHAFRPGNDRKADVSLLFIRCLRWRRRQFIERFTQ